MSELLVGYSAIAEFLHVRPRLVGKLAKESGLPIMLLGVNRVSTRAALLRWIERKMEGGVNG